MDRRDIKYYEERAQAINLEEITSSDEDNANVLWRLRSSDPEYTCLYIQNFWEDDCDFVIREEDDLGWLGYFAGQSRSLRSLYIQYLPQDRERNMAFTRGIECSESIQHLEIIEDIGDGFQSLGSLLKNDNLKSVSFNNFDIGLECARNIAFMINQRNQRNAIKTLYFEETNFSDGAVVEIARALSAHPQLEELIFGERSIGRNGCVALGNTLEGYSNPNLEQLYLTNNSFDDNGLQALVAGIRNCHNLTQLGLDGNESITLDGFRSLSTLFQSDLCHLKHLYLESMNIGDEGMEIIAAGLASLPSLEVLGLSKNSIGDDGVGALATGITSLYSLTDLDLSGNRLISARSLSALLQPDSCSVTSLHLRDINFSDDWAAALADGLQGNKSLKQLSFNLGQLTSVGWSAFSKLLCDTSSINNTYLSNHTLETIGGWRNPITPDDVKQLLALNKRTDSVAILKILKSHPDFNVEPLMLWKLNLLPLVMSWFERVGALVDNYKIYEVSWRAIQRRKLSTLFKFIRGMPLLAIDGIIHNNAAMSAHSRKRKINQL